MAKVTFIWSCAAYCLAYGHIWRRSWTDVSKLDQEPYRDHCAPVQGWHEVQCCWPISLSIDTLLKYEQWELEIWCVPRPPEAVEIWNNAAGWWRIQAVASSHFNLPWWAACCSHIEQRSIQIHQHPFCPSWFQKAWWQIHLKVKHLKEDVNFYWTDIKLTFKKTSRPHILIILGAPTKWTCICRTAHFTIVTFYLKFQINWAKLSVG